MMNWSLTLERNAFLYPDKESLICRGARFTWSQTEDRVNSLAQGLLDLGLRKGDVIGILLYNCLEYIELTFAINQIGATWVTLNFRLTAPEFQYILNHSEAKAIVTEKEFLPKISSIRGNVPTLKHGIILDSDSHEGMSSYNEMIENNYGAKPGHVEVGSQDLQRLMYTSGTTASPKGVMISYENLYWKNMAMMLLQQLTAQDKTLVMAPLYHAGAMDAPCSAVIYVGGTIVILRGFDVPEVLKTMHEERITNTLIISSMLPRIFEDPTFDEYDFSALRFIYCGGEKTPEALIRKFQEKFRGVWYADAYGLTETVSCDAILDKEHMVSKVGSVGKPVPHQSVRILDDDDKEVPANQLGEVCLKGPKVTKGYLKDPELTSKTIRDGWFHTGDIGKLDEEGFLYIEDRKKDMILSGGENIASPEVERVIYELPQVLEAAVVGIPDPKFLEAPMAYIVLKPGTTLSTEEIRAHLLKSLAKFKVPKIYEFLSELPRNPSGKVLKRELRDKYLRDHS